MTVRLGAAEPLRSLLVGWAPFNFYSAACAPSPTVLMSMGAGAGAAPGFLLRCSDLLPQPSPAAAVLPCLPARPCAWRALPLLAAAVCQRRRRLQDQGLELQAAQVGTFSLCCRRRCCYVWRSCRHRRRRCCRLLCAGLVRRVLGLGRRQPSPPPPRVSCRCLFTLLGHLDYIRTVQVRLLGCRMPQRCTASRLDAGRRALPAPRASSPLWAALAPHACLTPAGSCLPTVPLDRPPFSAP